MDLNTVKQATVLMFQDSYQPVAFHVVTGFSDRSLKFKLYQMLDCFSRCHPAATLELGVKLAA